MHIDVHVTQIELKEMETDADRLSESIRCVIEGGISDKSGTIYLSEIRVAVNVIDNNNYIPAA